MHGSYSYEETLFADHHVPICRYHFDKTLRLMKAYRIGRVHLPWTNLEPPIRGGVHRKLRVDSEDDEVDNQQPAYSSGMASPSAGSITEDSAEDSAEVNSLFSRAGDVPSSDESEPADADDKDCTDHVLASTGGLRQRTKGQLLASADGAATTIAKDSGDLPTGGKLSREAYTAAMEQKEIAEMVRTYPSLDQETQDAIRGEYRKLHQLVKEQGLYSCRYSEYGKEGIRYAIIFSAFLYFLHIKWYIPSACFLGLFWVSRCSSPAQILTVLYFHIC